MNQPNERMNRAVGGLAIGLWLVLAVVIVVKTVQNPENHSTYPIFRNASLGWWNSVDVYDSRVFGGDYRYGPSFAMLLGPIAWLPCQVGAVLWAVMNVGLAFWAIWALARRVLPGMQSPLARDLLLVISVFPSTHCLYASQTNLLVFSLVAFAAIAILDERWWLAALLLAMPVHIKIWPLAGALLLAACWPRRLAWRLPIALAVIAALPFLAKPPAWACQQYIQWYRNLVGPEQIRHAYRDAWTIWELISSPVNPRLYAALQLTAAAAILGLCLRQAGRTPPQRRVLFVLVCWTSWQLVFGPGTERNTFALIAPLTSWALVVAVLEKRALWLMALSFLLTILAAIGWVEDVYPWLRTLHPVGVCLFFAWFLHWNRQKNAESVGANLECGAGTMLAGRPPLSIAGSQS
ncbi:MAG: glycosyltransferase family 87 protein [Thermoguttaceae bacterium]